MTEADTVLRPFWIKFNITISDPHPAGTLPGVGVTAHDKEDALAIIKAKVFKGANLPRIDRVDENVAIDTLDKRHVLPNMGNRFARGVWFPLGYE